MKYKIKSKSVLRHSLNNVIYGGISQSAMDSFTSSTLLIGYAFLLGADNADIGILSAVPFIGNLIHIMVSYWLEKGYSVKRLSVTAAFAARPFYLLAAGLAFFAGQTWVIPALIFLLISAYGIGNIAGGAWRPWMKELVPNRIMGRFFACRFKYMMIAKIICFSAVYLILNYMRKHDPSHEIYVYSGLFVLTFFIGTYGAYTFTQVRDTPLVCQPGKPFLSKIISTFGNKLFVRLMASLGTLNFAVNFVTPFLTAFMLKRLGIPMSTVVMLTLFLNLVYTTVIKRLGRLADKAGTQTVLYVSVPFFTLAVFTFVLLNIQPYSSPVTIAVLGCVHILWGIGTAGIALGTNNLSLQYTPKKSSAIYLSVNSFFISLMGALGSIAGGLFITLCDKWALKLDMPTASWYIFFGVSIALCSIATIPFKYLKKSESPS